MDDYLDYFGGPAFGKKVGSDFLGGLATAPLLEFVDLKLPSAATLISAFRAGEVNETHFQETRELMIAHGVPERVRRRAIAQVEPFRKRIAAFPAIAERDRLDELLADVPFREH
jgi:geranylgeranyl pyrophosphate synthase